MDKYEYRVKTEQMLEYMEKKMYKEAMEIADTIDWRRVKNSTMLSTVSEIYECNGENQKSRDILFVAYDRSPGSRKIVYRLGTLAVKVDDLQEAMDCYEEFIALAPKDPNQYILKYKILKAQNAPKEQQIEALVDFKKVEYVEKWAYELAKLYHEAGLISECLEECDDLILWFSEGKYVFQAMELKMRHKPLTPLQQEKYNQCLAEHAKPRFKKVEEPVQQEEAAPTVDMGSTLKIELPEETVAEPGEVSVEETAVEEVAEESADAVVEEIAEEAVPAEESEEEVSAEPVSEGIITHTIVGATLEEALAKGVAAAAGIELPEEKEEIPEIELPDEEVPEIELPEEEPQTAHEKIEGILLDWEEKQREVEREIEEKRQQAEAERAEREARRREMAEQNMFNQAPIIPDDIQKLLEELENGILDSDDTEEEPADTIIEEAPIEEPVAEEEIALEEPAEAIAEVEVPAEPVAEAVEEVIPEEEIIEEVIVEEFEIPEVEEEPVAEPVPEEPEVEKTALEQLEEEIAAEKTKRSPGGVTFDTGFVVQGRYDLEAQSEIGLKAGLTEEQKKLFSYFVPVRGMSEQIVEVLHNDKDCKTRYGTSRTGNILVVGRQGTGKTVLAVNIVKAIQKARKLKQGKVAIVTGEALNKKELASVIGKLKGGALIIEKAGKMNPRTVSELNDLMEEQTGELLIVLEEQRKPIEKLLASNADFKRKFTSKLELPIFINDELVTFGQTYAKENGYKIDEMGILALYSRIDLMQKEDHAVTVAEVKEIMDDAIENAQKANVKHLMKRVFGKRTDNADRVILTEQDFR